MKSRVLDFPLYSKTQFKEAKAPLPLESQFAIWFAFHILPPKAGQDIAKKGKAGAMPGERVDLK